MAKKTLYLPDEHESTYERAKELAEAAGSKISNIFVDAIVRYVEEREGQLQGIEEVTLWLGVKGPDGGARGKYVRFYGKKIAEGEMDTGQDETLFQRLYRTRKGKYYFYSVTREGFEELAEGDVVESLKELEGRDLTNSIVAALKNEKPMAEFLDI